MSWINRSTVRTFSLVALVLAMAGASGARADAAQSFVFAGKALPISHVATVGGKLAISVRDPGLAQLLRQIGASLTWNPGERYVLFTTAEPQIISFAVGDTHYDVGPRSAQASFAPYELSGSVYLPFDELLGALYLAPKRDGDTTVIQPQLASFDVRSGGAGSTLVARSGIPLHPRVLAESATQLVYAFDGVGTTLDRSRAIHAEGIRAITFAQSGTVREPVTTMTIALAPGTTHGRLETDDRNGFSLAVGGGSPAPEPVAVETSAPAPVETAAPQATSTPAGGATVTGVDAHAGPNGYSVDIAVAGDASYAWRHLGEPDNRFWIDIRGATLATAIADVSGTDPVTAVRVRQLDASTVRVALSLVGQKRLDVQPSADGVRISVYTDDAGEAVARAGSGTIGNAAAVAAESSPVPTDGSGNAWKFAPRSTYVATNPRLIAIDPGHGGSDPGTVRGSVREADLTLDMAKRLRDILIARGWQVVMIRTTDVDVYKPNDSAHDELQARDDIANNAGARMLISIHANAYINAGPQGTTTYYSKPIDVALARSVQASAAAQLGTKDDGIVKSHLYVTLHANMPAVLVETAFISNPDDLAKLTSPDWRQKLALSIADGVKNYAGAPPAPSQSANQ